MGPNSAIAAGKASVLKLPAALNRRNGTRSASFSSSSPPFTILNTSETEGEDSAPKFSERSQSVIEELRPADSSPPPQEAAAPLASSPLSPTTIVAESATPETSSQMTRQTPDLPTEKGGSNEAAEYLKIPAQQSTDSSGSVDSVRTQIPMPFHLPPGAPNEDFKFTPEAAVPWATPVFPSPPMQDRGASALDPTSSPWVPGVFPQQPQAFQSFQGQQQWSNYGDFGMAQPPQLQGQQYGNTMPQYQSNSQYMPQLNMQHHPAGPVPGHVGGNVGGPTSHFQQAHAAVPTGYATYGATGGAYNYSSGTSQMQPTQPFSQNNVDSHAFHMSAPGYIYQTLPYGSGPLLSGQSASSPKLSTHSNAMKDAQNQPSSDNSALNTDGFQGQNQLPTVNSISHTCYGSESQNQGSAKSSMGTCENQNQPAVASSMLNAETSVQGQNQSSGANTMFNAGARFHGRNNSVAVNPMLNTGSIQGPNQPSADSTAFNQGARFPGRNNSMAANSMLDTGSIQGQNQPFGAKSMFPTTARYGTSNQPSTGKATVNTGGGFQTQSQLSACHPMLSGRTGFQGHSQPLVVSSMLMTSRGFKGQSMTQPSYVNSQATSGAYSHARRPSSQCNLPVQGSFNQLAPNNVRSSYRPFALQPNHISPFRADQTNSKEANQGNRLGNQVNTPIHKPYDPETVSRTPIHKPYNPETVSRTPIHKPYNPEMVPRTPSYKPYNPEMRSGGATTSSEKKTLRSRRRQSISLGSTDSPSRQFDDRLVESSPTPQSINRRNAGQQDLSSPPKMLTLSPVEEVDTGLLRNLNKADPFTAGPPSLAVTDWPPALPAYSSTEGDQILGLYQGMSPQLRQLTSGGTRKPTIEEALDPKNIPFSEYCRQVKEDKWGVVKISNIPYSITRSEVLAFLGRNARILPETESEAVHIIMERVTSKTLDCYVEFVTFDEAVSAVNRFETNRMQGRGSRLGQRHVDVELSSQESLMKDLFPKAKNVNWKGSRAEIIPRDPNDIYNSGFQGFLIPEELVMLVKHVETPQRSPFSKDCPQRPFECLISTLLKYPWYMVDYITIEDRGLLHKAAKEMMTLLVERIKNDRQDVSINAMLLKRVWLAVLKCPGFTPCMKDDAVFICGLDDATAISYGVPPYAPYWRYLWTIGAKAGVPVDVLLWYIATIRETTESKLQLSLADQAARGEHHTDLKLFGDLEKITPYDKGIAQQTLAQVAKAEWAGIEMVLRQAFQPALE